MTLSSKKKCHPQAATRPKDPTCFTWMTLRFAPVDWRVLVGVLALLAACGTKDAPSPLQPSDDFGRVRFVNMITDPIRNPVTAILENLPFGVGLAYTAATPQSLAAPSTAPYDPVYVGNRTVVVKRTADTSVTLATITFPIAKDEDKTVYATGGTAGAAVTNLVTTDVNTVPLATEVRLRIVNMSPSAGPVDVFVTAPGADLTGATPDAAGLASGAASAYFTRAPATYVVRFVPAGTPAAARNTSVTLTVSNTSTTNTAFTGGTARSIVAADAAAGGTPLRGFILIDR